MILDVKQLTQRRLREARAHYADLGYLRLSGLEDTVTPLFREILAARLGLDDPGMAEILEPEGAPFEFTRDERAAVSQIETSPELTELLLGELGPVLNALIGPLLHISSTFHGQFKGGDATGVGMGGGLEDHMEVRRPYLMHQDFAGARIPTSPSAVTFWVGVNTTPDWRLRLYPGSHKLGLLCHEWMELTDKRLAAFGEPVEIAATEGEAIMFNALLLHGTGEQGPSRRVSCDIRFFPLCGWLPSTVHSLADLPLDALRAASATLTDETLLAPLLEVKAFLGETGEVDPPSPTSVLNWAAYLRALMGGRIEGSESHISRFVNDELGIDPPAAYIEKFHGRPFEQDTLDQARRLVA